MSHAILYDSHFGWYWGGCIYANDALESLRVKPVVKRTSSHSFSGIQIDNLRYRPDWIGKPLVFWINDETLFLRIHPWYQDSEDPQTGEKIHCGRVYHYIMIHQGKIDLSVDMLCNETFDIYGNVGSDVLHKMIDIGRAQLSNVTEAQLETGELSPPPMPTMAFSLNHRFTFLPVSPPQSLLAYRQSICHGKMPKNHCGYFQCQGFYFEIWREASYDKDFHLEHTWKAPLVFPKSLSDHLRNQFQSTTELFYEDHVFGPSHQGIGRVLSQPNHMTIIVYRDPPDVMKQTSIARFFYLHLRERASFKQL